MAAVVFDDLADGGEADAAAGGLGTPLVAGEELFALVLWDAASPVADFDFAAGANEGGADADARDRTGDGVFEGVIDEVLEDADERFAVAEGGGQRVHVETCAGGGELGGEGDTNIAEDGVEFDDFAAGVCWFGALGTVAAERGFDEGLCAG